jgi:signal transduction histidine kinase
MPEVNLSGEDARERLLEAARLANVGRVVPAVAHDLSTPLAAIALRAESLDNALAGPPSPAAQDKLVRYLKAIREETERCKTLLATLQEFARRPGPAAAPVDLASLCRDAVRLVRHEAMRRQVELRVELQPALPSPHAHAPRLGHAVLSLLLNAIEASASGAVVVLAVAAEADGVLISVADGGKGLSDEARARLFEPLASTHPPDRAAGLGLMAGRSIAESYGGSLSLAAGVPAGTRAELRLPLRGALEGSARGRTE